MSKKNAPAEVYSVEKIIGDKEKDGIKYYHVKWEGYDDPEDLTWEPIENLKNCRKAIEEYENRKKVKTSEKNANAKASDFNNCQKFPFSMIKIDQNDPLLPKFTASPFAFRSYKKETDRSKKNFISIDNVQKKDDNQIIFKSETFQKASVNIDYDIMGMMFPIVLNNWMRDKMSSKDQNTDSDTKEVKATPIIIDNS